MGVNRSPGPMDFSKALRKHQRWTDRNKENAFVMAYRVISRELNKLRRSLLQALCFESNPISTRRDIGVFGRCGAPEVRRGLANRHMALSDQTLACISLAKRVVMSFRRSSFFFASKARVDSLSSVPLPPHNKRSGPIGGKG